MKQTVNLYAFREAFRAAGRQEQFSREALQTLFDYLEAYEADTGSELELDVVAICCDFAEDDPRAIAAQYGIDLPDESDDDEVRQAVADYLACDGNLVGDGADGAIVYRQH